MIFPAFWQFVNSWEEERQSRISLILVLEIINSCIDTSFKYKNYKITLKITLQRE